MLYLMLFILANIGLSLIMFCFFENTKIAGRWYEKSILQADFKKRIGWFGKSKWIIEKGTLFLVYCLYLSIDIFNNLFKLCNRRKYDMCLDVLILFYFFGGIALYANMSRYNEYDLFACNLFTWRIISILVIKMNEVLSFRFDERSNDRKLSQNGKTIFESYNRSFISFIINLFELVVGYAFIYSSSNVNILNGRDFDAVLKTLNFFTNWNIPAELCYFQKILVLSQIIIFFVMVSLYITNVPNFSFKNNIRRLLRKQRSVGRRGR